MKIDTSSKAQERRRVKLAAHLGSRFNGLDLTCVDEVNADGIDLYSVYDKPLPVIGLNMVAGRLHESGLLDHAFFLQVANPPWRETVGILSEPYATPAPGQTHEDVIDGKLARLTGLPDSVDVFRLTAAESAHYPGWTIPVVVKVTSLSDLIIWAAEQVKRELGILVDG